MSLAGVFDGSGDAAVFAHAAAFSDGLQGLGESTDKISDAMLSGMKKVAKFFGNIPKNLYAAVQTEEFRFHAIAFARANEAILSIPSGSAPDASSS